MKKFKLTELEFYIYSNALIRIVELIKDETQMNQIRIGKSKFVEIAIPTFPSANHVYDRVVFDRKTQKFIKIKYDKFITEDEIETFEIYLPDWLFEYMY